jgi:thioesterase CepJ
MPDSIERRVDSASVSQVDANGIRLAYDEHGAGQPVLLIGGTGMPGYAWDLVGLDTNAFIDAGFRVVTFDSRGVGQSDGPPGPYSVAEMAADTAALIESLGLAPCRLVGLSLGGSIAEELCATRPDLVRAAVLWASAGATPAFMRYKAQANHDVMSRGTPPPSWFIAEVLTIALPFDVLQNDDSTVEVVAALLADESPWSGDGRAGQLAADVEWHLTDKARAERWPHIECPCLVVAHEHDLMFPPRAGRVAAAAMPHGEFLSIGGVSHGQVQEAAPTVTTAALDFFART